MTNNITDILIAIGTLTAVAATVFFFSYEKIRNFLIRPILKIGINFHPPDCHKTKALLSNKFADAYWFRLYVLNEGKSTANDLEVSIEKVEKRIGDNWQIDPNFLLSNLVWTHINTPSLPILLPGTMKNIDLGYIIDPKIRYSNPVENNPFIENSMTEILFSVNTSVKPFTCYNILGAGDYIFSVIAGGANCKVIREKFRVTFTKDWFLDETKMLNESIKIYKT